MPKKRIHPLSRASYDRYRPFTVGHSTMREERFQRIG